ncbi:MAG: IS256 family transposase [Planctomycetes bacterium]|nr:IS256 family transposase [Planctomycetota bacterium]
MSTTNSEIPPVIDEVLIDKLMAQVDAEGVELLGPDGVLTELTKRIMERALDVERSDHLGYERGDPVGNGSGNSRNGTSPKTVLTDGGAVALDVPRDRNGTFEPKLVPKHERRLEGFNELVCSLVARGVSVRDTISHLYEAYGVEISPELVSKITDAVLPELREWQSRPLDTVYPIMYLDAIVVKVRADHQVVNKAVHIAMGVDVDGYKHVLGMWLQKEEGAKFWLGVLTEIRNRGVRDVLIVCCDGLTGFPDAIETVWPQATVQTCVVHLIRNAMKYVSYGDRKKVAAALKPIYSAPTIDAAADALDDFELEWGDRYPATVKVWRDSWERFTPFLQFDQGIRKVIYTTNAIESLNYQLRKVTKTKGHFPTDDAVLKILYLALRNIGNKRGGDLGTGTWGWKQALNAFAIAFPGRLPNQ